MEPEYPWPAEEVQPVISEDPRPRCGDEYSIPVKFGKSIVVTCDKYGGHTARQNNRFTRRHWNVSNRTGWFTPREHEG